MLTRIIGGVMLVAVGYGIRKWWESVDFFTPSEDYQSSYKKEDFSNSSDSDQKDFYKTIRSYGAIGCLFVSLRILQDRLLEIENLHELVQTSDSDEVLTFDGIDVVNISRFVAAHPIMLSERRLETLGNLTSMIEQVLQYFTENSVSRIDIENIHDESDNFRSERNKLIVKLFELNNKIVRALKGIQTDDIVATLFQDAEFAYETCYDEKYFKKKVQESA
ncbi:MAG: hypothetical protein ACTTH5_02815 [Wolinella sp.]